MRILIDTNIFICRETNQIVSENLQKLLAKLTANKVDILVHPLSLSELENDENEERKKVNTSKIAIYLKLELPPDPSSDLDFNKLIELPKNTHDVIDNHLIYSIYKNAVDFLVTEDQDILKKACSVNLSNRIFDIDEALIFITKCFPDFREPSAPPSISQVPISNLDIKDPIFDSLKEEYEEFEDWFAKISRKGRKAWVYITSDKKIEAITIHKSEDDAIQLKEMLLPAKKRLKICLLKSKARGQKVGELFLKLAFETAIKNDTFELYLTHFTTDNDDLVNLIQNYGFLKVGVKIRPNGREEDVYMKKILPDKIDGLSPIDVSKVFYPSFFDGQDVHKYIVPIKPEHHDRLFIEYKGRNTTLFEHFGGLIIEGNTITKAYLCNSPITKLKPGDILVFYRSQGSTCTVLGTIECVYRNLRDPNEIARIVGKRTVYQMDEIRELAKKPVLIILFKWHFNLKPISLGALKRFKILKAAPQSISKLGEDEYQAIKKNGGLDGRFAIN